MKRFMLTLLLALPCLAAKNLSIYFVDVEGGQATLLVSPAGESLLVDTGWPGFEGRDAGRIAEAAKKAGVARIDWLIITHFHTDHVGGIGQLAARMPILNVVDHGPTVESGKSPEQLYKVYEEVAGKAKRHTVKPGDRLPVKSLQVDVLSADGDVARRPGKPNPLCAGVAKKDEDKSENARSVGVVVTYGKFRFLDLGDLTWNKELDLACPENRIGKVDVYLTTHHGADSSGPAALVHAVAPRVAIMNNGEKKGGTPPAWQVVKQSPGLLDMWQLHFSAAGGNGNNVEEQKIANLLGQEQGHSIMVEAQSNGKFTVVNSRNGHKKSY